MSKQDATEEDFISENEASKLLPFSRVALGNLRKDGDGPPYYEFNGRYYDLREDVIAWREEHYRDGGTPPRSGASV